jgi:hypothetical protein
MYEIEKKSNRYIVWRLSGGRKLRQGSYLTEVEALERIEQSRKLIG